MTPGFGQEGIMHEAYQGSLLGLAWLVCPGSPQTWTQILQ